MSQNEIIKILEKNKGKKMKSSEIADKMKTGCKSISVSLNKLRKYKLVKFKLTQKRTRIYTYWV